MAMPVQPAHIGVDVAKAELVICHDPDQRLTKIPNEKAAIRAWLRGLSGPARIAVEATNRFHVELVEAAHRAGHTVYVVDALRLSRYRDSVGTRAKTDPADARLIQRYIDREWDQLRPWSPPPKAYSQIHRLLHRRATLVRAKTALQQSLRDLPELRTSTAAVIRRIEHLDRLIQKRLREALRRCGWASEVKRCQAIEGFGPIVAAAVVTAFHRGDFRNSDAFVAFLGLDVRPRDSGTFQGRRRLSKKGDSELRRLLYLAAMQAARQPAWRMTYQRFRDRGMCAIQAYVALARKLLRVAFAILKSQSEYQPRVPAGA